MGGTPVEIQLAASGFAVAHSFHTLSGTNLFYSLFNNSRASDKKAIPRKEEAK